MLDRQHARDQRGQARRGGKEAQKIVIDDAVWGILWYDNWTRVTRKDLAGVEKRWDTFDRYRDLGLKS